VNELNTKCALFFTLSSQQMPEEGRLFSTVDRNYKDIMRHLDKDQHVRMNTKDGSPFLLKHMITRSWQRRL
jgi:hypothetical protein